jgi:hypothetical protein
LVDDAGVVSLVVPKLLYFCRSEAQRAVVTSKMNAAERQSDITAPDGGAYVFGEDVNITLGVALGVDPRRVETFGAVGRLPLEGRVFDGDWRFRAARRIV